MTPRGRALPIASACVASLTLWACSLALDWREVRPVDSAVQVMFPCKPASHAREMNLAQQRTKVTLYACEAAGMTFAVAFASVEDPGRVTQALQDWRQAAEHNLGVSPTQMQAFTVPGQTPNPQAGHFVIQGQRPDGTPVTSHVLLAVKGTQVIQATVLGTAVDGSAVDTYLASVRLLP